MSILRVSTRSVPPPRHPAEAHKAGAEKEEGGGFGLPALLWVTPAAPWKMQNQIHLAPRVAQGGLSLLESR